MENLIINLDPAVSHLGSWILDSQMQRDCSCLSVLKKKKSKVEFGEEILQHNFV